MDEQEIWKDITGYEGLYQVSNLGRVKSLSINGITKKGFKSVKKEKILKAGKTGCKNSQYLGVVLRKKGKSKSTYVHRIVATAFIPNPENKKTVNHKDLDKLNNKATNLEWATYKENIQHSWENGACTPHSVKGIDHWKNKLTENQVREIKSLFNKKMKIREIAEKYGVSFGCISAIKYNITWKYIK